MASDYPLRASERSSTSSVWQIFVAVLLIGAITAGVLWFAGYFRKPQGPNDPLHDPNVKLREVVPREGFGREEHHRIQVIREAGPSAVFIDTLALARNPYDLTLRENREGTGSGFFWDDQGRIVTNFHVIKDTLAVSRTGGVSIRTNASIKVTLVDGTAWNARLVGIAPDQDLAVVQIDVPKEKSKPVKLGTSKDLLVGQDVLAIGNPFGESYTVTRGIISALNRTIASVTDQPIRGVIQIDAALNPGNSGGPLLDSEGRLIGVNTAINSRSGGNQGIGYAIPVDTVNSVVTELVRTGRASSRPMLGVVLLDEADTRQLGHAKGVMIRQVRPNSPAAKAGLLGLRRNNGGSWEAGDLILKIDQEEVAGLADLDRIMRTVQIGQAVKVTLRRGETTMEVPVRLEGM